MKKIIIFGASGLIGSSLVEKLNKKKYHVIAVSRDAGRKIAGADETIDKRSAVKEIALGVSGIINLAGASIAARRWSDEYRKILVKSRVDFSSEISDAVLSTTRPPEFFINASAVGYYGNSTEIKTEESPPGAGFLADLNIKWENAARKTVDRTRLVLPRIGVVLAKKGGALEKMTAPYRFFLGGPLGNGNQYISWIHIDDLIEIFLLAIENNSVSGELNACSPEPVSMNEFAKLVGRILGRPSFFRVPEFVLKVLMGESSSILLEGQRAIPAKLLDFGFRFNFPSAESALYNLLK